MFSLLSMLSLLNRVDILPVPVIVVAANDQCRLLGIMTHLSFVNNRWCVEHQRQWQSKTRPKKISKHFCRFQKNFFNVLFVQKMAVNLLH